MERNLEQIVAMLQEGNTEEGLRLLQEREKHADHQEMYDLAMIYNELGRADKAQPLIEELISHYPDEGELYTLAAENLIDMDREDEAMEWLLEIKEDDDSFVRAQMLLADLYQLQGLDEAAENRLKIALEAAPDEPVLLAGLGEYYLERGDFSKSIPYLKRAEHDGFEYPEGSLELRLAEAYSATGEFESALRYYEKGLKEHTDVQALFGYGFTALQLQDYELAARKLEELKDLDPEFVSLYPYLIQSLEKIGNTEQALKVAEDGLAVDEYNDVLYTESGKLYITAGDEQTGEHRLREALSLNPGNIEASLTLLKLWDTQEDYNSMIDLITYLREIGEVDARFDWFYGKALWEEDELEEAKEAFDSASSVYNEDRDFLEEYGRLLLELGDRKKALTYLQAAARLETPDEDLAMLIADLEEEL
ncbi:tetratricopeptide repeat protein [Alteribacillus iranensis]|uniref:Tetratricopeptide repeat-containing protein n=1 Tax=Alteribacillus iranensis TaxID=930128 RepID=A0A1I1ZRB1_9BACI|nr:tetratricopeptide repeat protein [Alteribacillus iranensis]SFE34186.1 Tetratricopeptide repeat-containing protein [Alteribacillus iranensis]